MYSVHHLPHTTSSAVATVCTIPTYMSCNMKREAVPGFPQDGYKHFLFCFINHSGVMTWIFGKAAENRGKIMCPVSDVTGFVATATVVGEQCSPRCQISSIRYQVRVVLKGASLRGRTSAARYRRSQEGIPVEQNANEADREVHDFRCILTTCKCQELHGPG